MPNLAVRRGDNKTWTFEVLDDGDAYDLSSVTLIRFTVKNDPDDADSLSILRKSTGVGGVVVLTQDDPAPVGTLGQFTVTLTHADTRPAGTNLVAADYHARYDIQLTLSGGEVVTPFSGGFTFYGDITHNSGDVGTDT
jgi:hypothetical protein